METLSKALLTTHIIAGFTSIVLFWIPVLVKKGSKIHNKVGKAYVYAMWVVVITAIILSIENFMQGSPQFAAFLGFLAIITAQPIWYGVAILKYKKKLPASLKQKHLMFNWLIVICGALLLGYGIYLQGKGQAVLMVIFGILGLTTGKDVYQAYKNPSDESNWIKEHITGMLTSAIAAYTAFFVFGSFNFIGNYFPGYWAVLPWTAPGVVGGILMNYYLRNYTKKKPKVA